jgi:hypothetical protein
MDGAMRVEMREVAIETQVYFTFLGVPVLKTDFTGTDQLAWSETKMNMVEKSWKLQ